MVEVARVKMSFVHVVFVACPDHRQPHPHCITGLKVNTIFVFGSVGDEKATLLDSGNNLKYDVAKEFFSINPNYLVVASILFDSGLYRLVKCPSEQLSMRTVLRE